MTKTLLDHLCEHAVSHRADLLEIKQRDHKEYVYARIDNVAVKIAAFPSSSFEGKELLANLSPHKNAARKKAMRKILGGQVYLVTVGVDESSGKDAFRVEIAPAPKQDPAAAYKFTEKQGQYLAFIYNYSKMRRQAPLKQIYRNIFASPHHPSIK